MSIKIVLGCVGGAVSYRGFYQNHSDIIVPPGLVGSGGQLITGILEGGGLGNDIQHLIVAYPIP
jgi:hypothetical protein